MAFGDILAVLGVDFKLILHVEDEVAPDSNQPDIANEILAPDGEKEAEEEGVDPETHEGALYVMVVERLREFNCYDEKGEHEEVEDDVGERCEAVGYE